MFAGRNNVYEATIRRMVRESLTAQEQQFFRDHEKDTDGQLLDYVRGWAAQLGHPPHPREIIGWELLIARFESWEAVLERAGLPRPHTPNKPSEFQLLRDEKKKQEERYRTRKAEKKERAQRRKRAERCVTEEQM